MLVVSRRKDESVQVGEARITIVRTGRTTRLGIEAPPHVKVVRGELLPHPEPPPQDKSNDKEPNSRAA